MTDTKTVEVTSLEKPGGASFLAQSDRAAVLVIGLALIALTLKLAIAYNTIGTIDAVIFYGFAKVLNEHSLEWTYQHSHYFNHPPLTAYYLRTIYQLTEQTSCQQIGLHFPFLLRLPGILADFLVVLVLLQMSRVDVRIPTWALALFAVSPVSLMVSGFHGNTDSVMVLFLVCAAFMCLCDRPLLCGIFFALGCQVKIVPLLLLPAFILFWLSRRRARNFFISGALALSIFWAEPLLKFPVLFLKNVLAYGGYCGSWGLTYCLRLIGLHDFARVSFFNLEPAQNFTMIALKGIIIGAALLIAWRRRHVRGLAFISSLAYTWIIFFVFAPGIGTQYLIWLAPFVLILSRKLYVALLISSSVFLFAFYNTTAGGLPWSVSLSLDEARQSWAPWSLFPWIVLIVGAIALWRKNAEGKSAADAIRFERLRAQAA